MPCLNFESQQLRSGRRWSMTKSRSIARNFSLSRDQFRSISIWSRSRFSTGVSFLSYEVRIIWKFSDRGFGNTDCEFSHFLDFIVEWSVNIRINIDRSLTITIYRFLWDLVKIARKLKKCRGFPMTLITNMVEFCQNYQSINQLAGRVPTEQSCWAANDYQANHKVRCPDIIGNKKPTHVCN